MLWFFYNILFCIVMLVLAPGYLRRMRKRGGYRQGFMQRFGWYDHAILPPRSGGAPRIWIHAVSVGEMLIALHLLDALRRNLPGREFVLSTNTSTGHALARKRLRPEDTLLYFPLDLPWSMRRAFDRIDPGLILIMECELWPNLLRTAVHRDIPVALVNARLSDRSFAGYRRVRYLFRRAASGLSAVYAQSERDATRFRTLGIPAERIHATGNAKYDLVDADPADAQRAAGILAAAGILPPARVILGGSTWPGEEERLMDALPRLRQAVDAPIVLVLAPRHVERCALILAAAHRRGLSVQTRRETLRRTGSPPENPPDLLLVDTTGELQHLYPAATIVFVGKSLDAVGGQNPIEPAAHGAAIIVGPHMQNFTDVVADLRAADAIVCINDAAALERALIALLRDPERREQLGRAAAAAVQRRRGAIARTLRLLPPPRERA